MTNRTDSEIAGIQLCLMNTGAQIDAALDLGDQEQFNIWRLRRLSLIDRLTSLVAAALAPSDTETANHPSAQEERR